MEQSGTICRRRVLAAVVCLTILLVPEIAAAAPAVKLNVQDAPVARDTHPATSFAPIAKRVSLNVVNIFSTRRRRASPPLQQTFLSKGFGPATALKQAYCAIKLLVRRDAFIWPSTTHSLSSPSVCLSPPPPFGPVKNRKRQSGAQNCRASAPLAVSTIARLSPSVFCPLFCVVVKIGN